VIVRGTSINKVNPILNSEETPLEVGIKFVLLYNLLNLCIRVVVADLVEI